MSFNVAWTCGKGEGGEEGGKHLGRGRERERAMSEAARGDYHSQSRCQDLTGASRRLQVERGK